MERPVTPPVLNKRSAQIQPLLSAPPRLRNVCILAHVDHGKTTLTDSLLASNGIISFRQAGRLRYLDSRDDEQERGITMESSAISLLYDDRRGGTTRRFVVNLIDSPGHVDFAGHVITASRLCDGAAVLVDVVEGVCTQTMAVLRQARRERLRLALVINKIDRLVTELQLDPQEAAVCIFKILEQVNAVYGSIDKEEGASYFDPISNVVLCSATDGWAFTLDQFADLYADRLGMDRCAVKKHLWGPGWSFDARTKQFVRIDEGSGRKCAFAQLVLHNIWSVYNASSQDERMNIARSVKISLSERECKSADQRAIARLIMSAWLPLSTALFNVFIDALPSPDRITLDRLHSLVPCDRWAHVLGSQTVGQVAKMFSVVKPAEIQRSDARDEREMLVGMARLFSGRLTVGDRIFILSPKYDPAKRAPGTYFEYTVGRLYLLMGRDLEAVDSVYSGNVFGVCGNGLEKLIVKSATLSSTLDVVPLDRAASSQAIPLLLKVAINPRDIADVDRLHHGLHTLCQADPCAEAYIQANGEQILAVAGELHLEMCLKDLKERFTDNVEFTVSPPLVPFRETFIVGQPNALDTLWKDLLCDVSVVDEQLGVLSVNFGYARVDLHAAAGGPAGDAGLLVRSTALDSSLAIKTAVSKNVESSLSAAFRVAVELGPLCNEGVSGMHIVVTGLVVGDDDPAKYCGRLITDFAVACHAAMMFWSPRLQLAYYACDIQTSADFLGRVYGVLSKRHGKIVSEEYNEATGFFTIHSRLPVIESFGFGHDLRSRTSGIAVPQLLFSGFDTLDIDPFALDPDSNASAADEHPNDAMRYLMDIRQRKGMFVERRIVECAEKQRTLKK